MKNNQNMLPGARLQVPLIVAHRGATQLAPENSLAAFALAIEKGADAIEFDVHFSSDRQAVIHHDYYLGRTESGTGYIGDYSLAELQSLDIGENFGAEFSGEKMPTLRNVLELFKGQVRFEIELRSPSRAFLECVLDEIAATGVAGDVEITSPHIPLLAQIKNLAPDLPTGVFFKPFPDWQTTGLGQQHLIDWLVLLDARVAHLPFALLEKDLIDRLHRQKFLVHACDLRNQDEIEKAICLEIDQFSTDVLEMAVQARASCRTSITR